MQIAVVKLCAAVSLCKAATQLKRKVNGKNVHSNLKLET